MEEVEILQVDTSESVKSLSSLKAEIKDLKSQLLGLEEGTEEYNKVLVECSDKMHELVEIQEQTKASSQDFGDRMSNVSGTISGMSGAVQTVTGALALMGVEMGDDSKLMKTLVAAMSITQGVQAIDSGIKAFKALKISIQASTMAMSGLKKALISTGIGALVVGVGLLIANFDKLKNLISGTTDESKKFAKANAKLKESLEDINRQYDYEIAVMEQDGKSKVEIAQKRYEAANAAYQEAQATYDLISAKKKLNDEEKAELETARQVVNERWSAVVTAMTDVSLAERQERKDKEAAEKEAAEKRLQAQKAAAQKASEQRKEDLAQIAKIEREAQIGLMDDQQGELAKLEDTYKEQLALYKKRGQDTATLTEYYEQQQQEIIDKYEQERKDKEAEAAQAEIDARTDRSTALLAALDKQLQDEQNLYDQQAIATQNQLAKNYSEENVEKAKKQMDIAYDAMLQRKIELEQELLQSDELLAEDRASVQADLLSLQQQQADRSVAIEKAALDKRKTLYKSYSSAVKSITSSIGSILGSIGDTLEEGASEWKAVKIAESIISTIQGGIAAYMGMVESIPGPAGIIAGAVAAAATVASGMVEVNKIRNTQISTSGSGTSSATGTTALGSVSNSALSVAATQVTNTRNTNTTSDIDNLPDTKVYVLESDITNAQHNVRTTVSEATF